MCKHNKSDIHNGEIILALIYWFKIPTIEIREKSKFHNKFNGLTHRHHDFCLPEILIEETMIEYFIWEWEGGTNLF